MDEPLLSPVKKSKYFNRARFSTLDEPEHENSSHGELQIVEQKKRKRKIIAISFSALILVGIATYFLFIKEG